jgi:hypothetical protein
MPADIARLVGKLQSGTDEEKVKAAEALAARGEKARPAARALCEAAVGPTKEVSRGALGALEKVAPELHEPIFTLVVDGQAVNHIKAIAELRKQGANAQPAVPVILHQIRKCQDELRAQADRRFAGGGWGAPTLFQVISHLLFALPRVAPEDPEVLQAIIRTTKTSSDQPGSPRKDRVETTIGPFSLTGIHLLGELAAKKPVHRKQIIPEMLVMLKESVQRVNQESSGQQLPLLRDLALVRVVSNALLQCGPDAKETLAKEVMPQLKDLEFHKDAKVRATVKDLRTRIEAGPSALVSGFPINEMLQSSRSKRYLCPMKAGRTYVIDLQGYFNDSQGYDLDTILHLMDPSGHQVAQATNAGEGLNATRIVFRCRSSGNYEINAGWLHAGASGAFQLNVREQ